MQIITVNKNEAGQRLDKLLAKYLNEAPKSFLYKMLRKKNITLNGKKADGSEHTMQGDEIRLFLSDETVAKFSRHTEAAAETKIALDIVYENEDILLVNKPCGMLSQKAAPSDISLVEHLIAYLTEEGAVTSRSLQTFRPSICNRLDRNTSGLVAAGKSLAGLQALTELIRNRGMEKYYLCMVKGSLKEERLIDGYLVKDSRSNQVSILKEKRRPDALPIRTRYRPVAGNGQITLLEVELITGRSHQIRAHLASIGHPILGDAKYGDEALNRRLKERFGLKHQLLHAWRITFPALAGTLAPVSGHTFTAKPPELFETIRKEMGLDYGDLEFQRPQRLHLRGADQQDK